MIVNSPSLTLTAQELTYPVVGYDNVITAAGITATTEEAANPASNMANPATHLKWRGGANTAGIEIIALTFSTIEDVNYIGIARHNLGTEAFQVEVLTNDSPAISLVTAFVPSDDLPIIIRFVSQHTSGLRVRLTPTTQTVDPPEIAVMYAGTSLLMERSLDIGKHTPLPLGRKTTVVNGRSTSGQFLGRIVLGESRESVAKFEWFTPDWYRANFDPFVDAAQEVPFFWAWYPSAYPLETGYGWLAEDPQPEVDTATLRVGISMKMQGVA